MARLFDDWSARVRVDCQLVESAVTVLTGTRSEDGTSVVKVVRERMDRGNQSKSASRRQAATISPKLVVPAVAVKSVYDVIPALVLDRQTFLVCILAAEGPHPRSSWSHSLLM